jgi:chromosome segregation ATPase
MAEDLAATEQPPAAAERSDAAAEAGLVDQVAERNRQLKAALMDDQPEVVVETPGSVQDQDGIAATTSPAPASEPPAALQKQNSTKRPLARQESAADQRAAAADQRAAAAAERATERAAAAAAAEKQEAQKLERQIREQTAKLEALRERASDVGADQEEWAYPKEVVAEARKRRDAERAQHAHERARLAMVSDERKKTSKQIDRLVATAAAAAATEPAASDAADELPDDPEVLEKEIKAMRRQEVRLQAAVPKLEETRFFLEKVRNERRDVGRRVRANQAEVNSLEAQLATKAEQLQELQELAQPSAVTQHYQTETKRLQRAVSELAAKRVSSEREISKQGQRLERVRSVMSSFLKAQQLPKARPLQLPAYNPLQPLTTPHNPSHKPLTTF